MNSLLRITPALITLWTAFICSAQDSSPFVPAEFEVPVRLETETFILVPLHPDLVVLDYEAWITSVEHIKFSRHHQAIPGWPSQQGTIAQNLRGLKVHYKEFVDRDAFAYAILATNELTVLGTVYIRPSWKEGYDAAVNMWVRTSEYHKGFDPILFSTVKDWIESDWPFETPAYLGRDMSWEVWEDLPDKT